MKSKRLLSGAWNIQRKLALLIPLFVLLAGAAVVDAAFTVIDLVEQGSAPALSASGHARMYAKTDHTLLVSQNGGAYAAVGGGGTVTVSSKSSSTFTNNTTTPSTVTSVSLASGVTYSCHASLIAFTNVAADGFATSLTTTGLTATNAVVQGQMFAVESEGFGVPQLNDAFADNNPTGYDAMMTNYTAGGATDGYWSATWDLSVTTTGAGTLALQAAQVAHTTGTLTVSAPAVIVCTVIP